MTKIHDILAINLQEDIKSVIDLEDSNEIAIQQEIESYIVTDGIAGHLDNFINLFNSGQKETGVWISGFYGSGKSYFGKMLGYIIDNPKINGTPARERFITRLQGVKNAGLLENAIRRLEIKKSRVVFLDVAKQNTEKGLAYTLFVNFLKNLGFRDDIYGFMEFDLSLNGKYDEFKNIIQSQNNKTWEEIRKNKFEFVIAVKKAYEEMGYNDSEYNKLHQAYTRDAETFSAGKLKSELKKHLEKETEEILVFIFDEASEAVAQKKFTLLDLEGVSEALSSIGNKVWTIAIAQEKLDDVISNTNINRSQLTKVTDRFRTKLHLESKEVDFIIRSRLLQKRDEKSNTMLSEYYRRNEGLISSSTKLNAAFATETPDADCFVDYYPFHKYQFDIMQKFLFSSKSLSANQIAERGMIMTTFDVLRRQMYDEILYNFATAFNICAEAQPSPDAKLVNKYETAVRIARDNNSELDGKKILQTIHFLTESEAANPTSENITKGYISDITTFHKIKPEIDRVLKLLEEGKLLLCTNNSYKITSDMEVKMLDEMRKIDVRFFEKKAFLTGLLKEKKVFSDVYSVNDGGKHFRFSIKTDLGDELTQTPGDKNLCFTIYNLFSMDGNLQDLIYRIRLETQNLKNTMTLIPDSSGFEQIDKLIDEILRYKVMQQNYSSETDNDKKKIISNFSTILENKERDLYYRIDSAYKNAGLVYLFDSSLMKPESFKETVNQIQKKLVTNVYTKRLGTQLSDDLVTKIFPARKDSLHRLFSGEDFIFFDKHGNFVGDNLRVVEEIKAKISFNFIDGKSLEELFSAAPWGYDFGTIISTLAALFRAGRLSVRHGGTTYFYKEKQELLDAFNNSKNFRAASFKFITKNLTMEQRRQAIEILKNLPDKENTIIKSLDWGMADFELAENISKLSEYYINALENMRKTVADFNSLFNSAIEKKRALQKYNSKINESNYIEQVELLLKEESEFVGAVNKVYETGEFINKKLAKVRKYKKFIDDIAVDLKKPGKTDQNIQAKSEEFFKLYNIDMVKNYSAIAALAQEIKDCYYCLYKTALSGINHTVTELKSKINAALSELKNYPAELNVQNKEKLNKLLADLEKKLMEGEPNLDYSISCSKTNCSYSEILTQFSLMELQEKKLEDIKREFVREIPPSVNATIFDTKLPVPPVNIKDQNNNTADYEDDELDESEEFEDDETTEEDNTGFEHPKTRFCFPGRTMSVSEYKKILQSQLDTLKTKEDDEQIEIFINAKG